MLSKPFIIFLYFLCGLSYFYKGVRDVKKLCFLYSKFKEKSSAEIWFKFGLLLVAYDKVKLKHESKSNKQALFGV